MKNVLVVQYLTKIKVLVNNIASVGARVDIEDIILYSLNGLSSQYYSFKTMIRTHLNLINLEDFYSLLISEEISVAFDLTKKGNPN